MSPFPLVLNGAAAPPHLPCVTAVLFFLLSPSSLGTLFSFSIAVCQHMQHLFFFLFPLQDTDVTLPDQERQSKATVGGLSSQSDL
jgi:hypothetical protein